MNAPASWVLVRPDYHTRAPKPVSARGVNPCLTPEPGFGVYGGWQRPVGGYADLLIPKELKLGRRGEFDVVFHFHGREPARKEWIQAANRVVWVGVDLGKGSAAYQAKFAQTEEFWNLLAEVEDRVALAAGAPLAGAEHIGLTAWSAGYGAVGAILHDPRAQRRTDFVGLLDGLHAAYDGAGLDLEVMSPFVQFARSAAQGKKLMFVTHSSIIPPDYASTTETANFLIWAVGGRPGVASEHSDPLGLERIREFHQQGFHVVGFNGAEAIDHCAQVGMLRSIATDYVAPRWQATTGRRTAGN